ncbi:MAG: hypothetical protein M3155_01810 [Actinomycetota bacterium]|nr:hypothetical protein [Actinomycetota bacterium]
MANDAVLEGHMARGNELMAEIREEMSLSRSRYEAFVADSREFMREMIQRFERVTERHAAVLDRQVRVLDDLHDEILAQRQALLQIFD